MLAINRLVQQTEHAALNLRRVSSIGIVALQANADRAAVTAQSRGESLNIPHPDNTVVKTVATRPIRAGLSWAAEAVQWLLGGLT